VANGNGPERATIDINVAWDYTDEDPVLHPYIERLFELARDGVVQIAIAATGHNYDVTREGPKAARLRQLIADEGIEMLSQLSYVGEHTYPGTSLSPGAFDAAFVQAWDAMLGSWKSHEGKKPGRKDRLPIETHLLCDRDVFITRDRALLVMCRRLRDECGFPIDAVRVDDYIARHDGAT
jgi:hypothetical protein